MASTKQIESFREAIVEGRNEREVLDLLKPLETDDSEEVRKALAVALKHPSELVKKKATKLLADYMAHDLGEDYLGEDYGDESDEEGEGATTLVVGVIPSPQLAAEAAKQSCLVVIHGNELGKKIDLESGKPLVMGRGRQSDVQLDQDSVSRRHAMATIEGKKVWVEDLGSTNGTYVNDRLITAPHILRDGDLLSIGRTIFKFFQSGNIEQAYHEEIYRLTTVDSLTQVYNKRYLMDAMSTEIARSHRYSTDLSLVMFDIDHFKNINDTHGHLAGDHILRELSLVIKNSMRQPDIMGRYGGEEFAILLTDTKVEGALTFAEKIRSKIAHHEFFFDNTSIPVTISLGVAQLDASMAKPEDLIEKADVNLYKAKQGGRNRVVG